MIFFDVETTGLVHSALIPIDRQPRITEIACLKDTGESFHQYINPGVQLSDEIIKITGVTNEDLKSKPKFSEIYNDLVEFFIGERSLVAHNLAFDSQILMLELTRLGKEKQFPWPPDHQCTVELTTHIHGYRMSLTDLHKFLFDTKFKDAHNALIDAIALKACYDELKDKCLI
jgi:DNA polymerase-3 subunit epsilon